MIKDKEEELTKAKKLLPELLSIYNSENQKQDVHSFKDLAGIKTVLKDILNSNTEILDFGAEFKIKEYLPYDYKHWDDERVKRRIKMRIVANIKIKPTKLRLTEIKYVPSEFHSNVSTYIYDNKVALIMWVEDPLAIIIENRAVNESYKNYFQYLWKISKK